MAKIKRRYLKNERPTWCHLLFFLFHFLCAQHVSDINTSIFRSLRLCWWITTSVVLFCKDGRFSVSVNLRCMVVRVWCDVFCPSLQNETTVVVIQQHSRKLLMMDILMSETCWAHKKWNKLSSDIKLAFPSSTITMMYNAQCTILNCVTLLTLWRRNYFFFNFSTPCI